MTEKTNISTDSTLKRRRFFSRRTIKVDKVEPKVAPETLPEVETYDDKLFRALAEVAMPERPYKSDRKYLDQWINLLEKDGEPISFLIKNKYDDIRLIDGLKAWSEQHGEDPFTFIKHSNRFAAITHQQKFDGLTVQSDRVEIPESDANVHHTGRRRRQEEGPCVRLEYLQDIGIDPNHVLFFRVTQPANDGPKPEYYWTSDIHEVTHSLWREGSADGDPQILVSTLADISQNGGLILDVNDDGGIAVRQIGLEPYDQNSAMFSFPRF